MRILTLSDHTTDQASKLARIRHHKYGAALVGYTAAISSHALVIEKCRNEVSAARASRAWWAWLRAKWRLWQEKTRHIARPQMDVASNDERVWNAGKEGEARVARVLGAQLSDEWTLVQGYHGTKGEIDQILVGPKAVIAIEIKNTNGVVHVHGDAWTRDKYDNYGNLIESGLVIADRGGRSPSRQINEAADELRELLKSRVGVTTVSRAIVLCHEKAQVGRVVAPTIQNIFSLSQMNGHSLVARLPVIYDGATIQSIVKSIEDGHQRNHRRRSDSHVKGAKRARVAS